MLCFASVRVRSFAWPALRSAVCVHSVLTPSGKAPSLAALPSAPFARSDCVFCSFVGGGHQAAESESTGWQQQQHRAASGLRVPRNLAVHVRILCSLGLLWLRALIKFFAWFGRCICCQANAPPVLGQLRRNGAGRRTDALRPHRGKPSSNVVSIPCLACASADKCVRSGLICDAAFFVQYCPRGSLREVLRDSRYTVNQSASNPSVLT